MLAIDVDLGKNRKCDAEIPCAKRADLRVCSRFLMPELIAGEGQNFQPTRPQRRIQILQPRILRRKPALRRYIHHQQHLAMIIRQRLIRAVAQPRPKIINVHMIAYSWGRLSMQNAGSLNPPARAHAGDRRATAATAAPERKKNRRRSCQTAARHALPGGRPPHCRGYHRARRPNKFPGRHR